MHIIILAIGEIAYLFSWFVSIVNLVLIWNSEGAVVSALQYIRGIMILAIYPWFGWWIRRALCAKFGLFFTREWEFKAFANYTGQISNGLLHKFWAQAVLIITILVAISLLASN